MKRYGMSNRVNKYPESIQRGNDHFTRRTGISNFDGTKNPNSKLNEEKVREIREKYKTGLYTQKQLGNEYGVSQSQIWFVVSGNNWKKVV